MSEPVPSERDLVPYLRENKERIIDLWTKKMEEDRALRIAAVGDELRLKNGIPRLLERLLEKMEQGIEREKGECEISRAHAEERYRQGYSQQHIVREVSLLRKAIEHWCERKSDGCKREEWELVGDVLDEAMANAAVALDRSSTRELMEEGRLREQLMGVIAHDLRQPLTTILGRAQNLLTNVEVVESLKPSIRSIVRSANRMDHMIKDMLDFTRVRKGIGLSIERQYPTSLIEICRDMIDEAREWRRDRTISFQAYGSCRGNWDPARLAQVVANLVSNALSYSPPQTPVSVKLVDEGNRVVLYVNNSGKPIPPDMLADGLFKPFNRGKDTASQGLGLGLYIMHEIVLAHEGEVTVSSSEEKGTEFAVRLPKQPQSAA